MEVINEKPGPDGRLWEGVIVAVVMTTVGIGLCWLLSKAVPEPPPGICDATGTSESCTEWWMDQLERP
jgi:hypothetical protein